MWNVANLGYMPLKLVLGTAVYSLGLIGGLKAMFKGLVRGEISDLTSLIYDAREHAIGLIRQEAERHRRRRCGGHQDLHPRARRAARIHGHRHRRQEDAGRAPASETLPVQALIRDKDTWIGNDDLFSRAMSAGRGGGD